MAGKRVLVCGGRHYSNRQLVFEVLDAAKPTVVIHGGATGADHLAGEWADEHKVECWKFPVTREQWDELGKAAGPMRNKRMLAEGKPDVVYAFKGGRGTKNMIKQARRAGVPVLKFNKKEAPSG